MSVRSYAVLRQLRREDIEVVLAAVQDNGHSLEFAGERLRDDREANAEYSTPRKSQFQFATHREVSESRGTLLGSLLQGNPAIWGLY